jgi:hypothetical protein
MFVVGVYDQMKKAFQDILAPEIHALRGEIRVIRETVVRLYKEGRRVDAFNHYARAAGEDLSTAKAVVERLVQ